jgi:hypothetical protein
MHLSTALVLMLTAGIIMWANTRRQILGPDKKSLSTQELEHAIAQAREKIRAQQASNSDSRQTYAFGTNATCAYGWPFRAVFKPLYIQSNVDGTMQEVLFRHGEEYYGQMVTFDCVIGLLILAGVWFACESVIWQNSRGKEALARIQKQLAADKAAQAKGRTL